MKDQLHDNQKAIQHGAITYGSDEANLSAVLKQIADHFVVEGAFRSGHSFGSGHINDTYALEYATPDKTVRYVLQRINTSIFKQPQSLMENILRITRHQLKKMQENGEQDVERKYLNFFPTKTGDYVHVHDDGSYWRLCRFIERAHTEDIIQSAEQAFLTAAAFAQFQKTLADLPGERLHETIPHFHDTASRFSDFEIAVQQNLANRVALCKKEIDFARERQSMVSVLIDLMQQKKITEAVTHNDTKINNIMLDDETNEALCVIDLDTVMPGSSLYDFGDMVRSSSCTAAEDEKDLSQVEINMTMFEALARGYLSVARDFLNTTEIDHLAFCGKLLTFEQGLRFLSDYLNGDTYFKVTYPEHNLVRAQNQFKLVASIEQHEAAMQACVQSLVIDDITKQT